MNRKLHTPSGELELPPRILLAHAPTRIERLSRLSEHLASPEIYVKRDDQTGLATGGNKTRKLEFVLHEAVTQGCDHLVTLGGPQSNHVRQTAAAAASLGLRCSVVLRGHPPARALGNLLLDELLGADVHWSGDRMREEVAEEVMATLCSRGDQPYLIPLGASTPLGALGYVVAMREALEQLNALELDIDVMVLASSSAGTQAGLALGAALFGFQGIVLGISIDAPADDLTSRVAALARGAAQILDRASARGTSGAAAKLNIQVNADYLGAGYAIVGERERDALRTVARTEGLLLDPVYTGRAMGGLIDLIRRGVFTKGQRILFWHTGGAAALSAFSKELSASV